MQEHRHSEQSGNPGNRFTSRWGLALMGFAVLGGLLLIYEHRLHIPFGNLLVILPLFVCMGLHSLMHGGHGGHGHRRHDATGRGSESRSGAGAAADQGKDGQP
jgi:hypothetical protein